MEERIATLEEKVAALEEQIQELLHGRLTLTADDIRRMYLSLD